VIYVARSSSDPVKVSEALSKPFPPDKTTELDRARKYYAQKPAPKKAYNFKRYKEWIVCEALDELFHEKCAYCESNYRAVDALNVEHFRPKGAVHEEPGHPGYWWLAAVWSNLLPSCPPCNQLRRQLAFDPEMTLEEFEIARQSEAVPLSGKANSFPLRSGKWVMEESGDLGVEDPLLINPCVKDPASHLEWVFDWNHAQNLWEADPVVVFVHPRRIGGLEDPYGRASISIYGLNRSGLLRERMALIKVLQSLCVPIVDHVLDLAATPNGTDVSKPANRLTKYKANLMMFTRAERPYAGMARAFVALFNEQLTILENTGT
jgi:hypothetical protein